MLNQIFFQFKMQGEKMKIKKTILTLALIGAGVYAFQRCNKYAKLRENVQTGENRARIEKLVEDASKTDRKNNSLDELMKYVEKDPEGMKSCVLDISEIGLKSSYRREIWDRLSKEEKWYLIKEVSEYKANEFWDEAKELSKDAYEKSKETRIYNKIMNERRSK